MISISSQKQDIIITFFAFLYVWNILDILIKFQK